MTPGKGHKKSSLKRITVLDQLRRALTQTVSAAPAGPVEENTEAVPDPMGRLDAIEGPAEPKLRGTRYKSVRSKKTVTAVEMPAREPTKHPRCEAKRDVRLYPYSTSSLYLSERDLEWFLDWVWDELETGGVTVADPPADLAPNCAAPGVHIQWVFGTPRAACWEAIVLEGPRAGQRVKSSPNKMDATKWEVLASSNLTTVSFADASRHDIKNAAWHFLEMHMARVVSSDA